MSRRTNGTAAIARCSRTRCNAPVNPSRGSSDEAFIASAAAARMDVESAPRAALRNTTNNARSRRVPAGSRERAPFNAMASTVEAGRWHRRTASCSSARSGESTCVRGSITPSPITDAACCG